MFSNFLSLFSAAFATSVIHELQNDTLQPFLTTNNLSLVSFIAPWCPYCKELQPVYEATALAAKANGWPLAQIDCTKDEDICDKYRIPIFPTLKIFHGEESSIYNGPRNADAIMAALQRHSRPAISSLAPEGEDAIEAVTRFRFTDNVTVIGYFDSQDKKSKEMFKKAATRYRDSYSFAVTSSSEFGEAERIKMPSVVLYKTFDERKTVLSGKPDLDTLNAWIEEAATPTIRNIPHDVMAHSGALRNGKPMAYLFSDDISTRKQYADALYPFARKLKDEMIFVTVDTRADGALTSKVNLPDGDWPAFGIEDGEKLFKYPLQTDTLSVRAIEEFVTQFRAGTLQPYLKSESIPTTQVGPVTDIVGDSYEELVIKSERDMLMLYYSPTCPHCQKMKPSYEKLALLLKPLADVIGVAQINAVANDMKFKVKGYPSIKLFESGRKDAPMDFEGNRTTGEFLDFLRKNGGEKFKAALEGLARQGHEEL